MRKIAEMISYLSLVLLVVAPVLFYSEKILLPATKNLLLVATIVWFMSALFWIGREKGES